MVSKISKPVWNLLAVFFAAWGLAAACLLTDGDSSPVVRFAFAVCGGVVLFAGSSGGLFRIVGRGFRWLWIKNLGHWVGVTILVLVLWLIFSPVFQNSQEKVRSASTQSDLKNKGIFLTRYVQTHNGLLPPNMRDDYIDSSLAPYYYITSTSLAYPPFGKPYVWCKELAGLNCADIAEPESVVVAYSRAQLLRDGNTEQYTILFLDGYSKQIYTRQKLLDALRKRPALLAHAIHAKARRDADAKKAAP